VRNEGTRRVEFDSQHVFGMVGILLAAVIAAYSEVSIDGGRRKTSVRLAERNSVAEEHVLNFVKSMVLAEHDPIVQALVSHVTFPSPVSQIANWWRLSPAVGPGTC